MTQNSVQKVALALTREEKLAKDIGDFVALLGKDRFRQIVETGLKCSTAGINIAADVLRSTSEYKLLNRLDLGKFKADLDQAAFHEKGDIHCVYVDVETTGLDPKVDKIIQFAAVEYYYSEKHEKISKIGNSLSMFNDPGFPVPKDIVDLTGITDDHVRGHKLNIDLIKKFVADAFGIAHNANFDAKFCEACDIKPGLGWGCSLNDIDWAARGYRSKKLGDLVQEQGYFFDAHLADSDTEAGVALLIMTDAMSELIENAHKPAYKLFAEGSHFDDKEILKAHKWRWDPDSPIGKNWTKIVTSGEIEEELVFLGTEIFRRQPNKTIPVATLMPKTRFLDLKPDARRAVVSRPAAAKAPVSRIPVSQMSVSNGKASPEVKVQPAQMALNEPDFDQPAGREFIEEAETGYPEMRG